MIFEYFETYQKERNIFLPFNEILKRAEGKTDAFCSIFGYDPQLMYEGPLYGPLYFDLDKKGDITCAYKDAQTLLSIFSFYGVTDQDYQLSFSGYKGFHLIIYPQVLDVKPQSDLAEAYKQIAGWFIPELPYKTLDTKVYERRRLWRIVNTKNGKTGLHKIPLTGKESVDEIYEKAKTPQEIVKKNPKLSPVLSTWIERALEEIAEAQKPKPSTYFVHDKSIAPQVLSLINTGVQEGNRNHSAFYLACYLHAKLFSEQEAHAHLSTFAQNCSPTLPEWEIRSVIKSAYKRSI